MIDSRSAFLIPGNWDSVLFECYVFFSSFSVLVMVLLD